MKINYFKLIASILICQGAGLLGSLFTSPTVKADWYINLNKPAFQPPDWLFGPVWITLFLLMGISLYIVWNVPGDEFRTALPLGIFIFQLVLNIMWSFLFFYLKNPFMALMEIFVLWLAILVTLILFYRISKIAGLLLIPYLLWVAFAACLNFFLWNLNRG
jgi:tryptophan-rich sensory protein